MPRICAFFGIVITMNHDDHLPPHFHVRYSGQRAALRIDTLEVISGSLQRRVLGMVIEWAHLHRLELAANWERARNHHPLVPIAPLD